eukprot:10854083-Prorocentrum_lima.AAC.1
MGDATKADRPDGAQENKTQHREQHTHQEDSMNIDKYGSHHPNQKGNRPSAGCVGRNSWKGN